LFIGILHTKIIKTLEKRCFAYTEKISGLSSIYFHAKTILFGDYFLAYLVYEASYIKTARTSFSVAQ
jgi:hypothetical protein